MPPSTTTPPVTTEDDHQDFSPNRPSSGERDISDELEIIWLEPPESHPYVREYFNAFSLFRQRRPRWHSRRRGRLIGYSILRADARSKFKHLFCRREFWLDSRTDPYPGSGHPFEAVDPLRIKPGQWGVSPRPRATIPSFPAS